MNNRMREIAFTLFSAMNGVPSRTGGEQQQPVASTTTQHTAAINREALIPLRRALQRRRAPILAINTGSASAHALFVDVKRVLRALSDVAVRREPQRPFNVLVIGGTGTGKTSLILSIRHAVERGAARADSGLMSMPLPPLAPSHAAVLRYKRHHLSRTIASVNMEPALCFFELDGGDTGWPALERESDAERTFWTRVVGGVNETDDAMATIMATDFEGNARNRIDVCVRNSTPPPPPPALLCFVVLISISM
jgi:hypothetical protein